MYKNIIYKSLSVETTQCLPDKYFSHLMESYRVVGMRKLQLQPQHGY
jgi:hypothetical protein